MRTQSLHALFFIAVCGSGCEYVLHAVGRTPEETSSSSTTTGAGTGGGASIAVTLAPSSVTIVEPGQASVVVTIPPQPADVTIDVAALPAQVTRDPLVIPAGATSGTLVLHADASAPQGSMPLAVHATEGAAAGSAALALLVRGAPGTLDTTFGNGGSIDLTDAGQANAVLVDSKGRILVAGTVQKALGGSAAMVNRYRSDGTHDMTFGLNGHIEVQTKASSNDEGVGIVIDAAGGILVAGKSYDATASKTSPFVARFTDGGVLDTSFGSHGQAFVSNNWTYGATAANLMVRSNGEIALAGSALTGATSSCAMVALFTSDGQPIGSPNELCVNAPTNVYAAVHGGDVLFLLGSENNQLDLAQYNPPSSPFDVTVVDPAGTGDAFEAGAVLPDGSVVGVGTASKTRDIVMAHVTSQGMEDTNYGTQGIVHIHGSTNSTYAGNSAAVDSMGRVVIVGSSSATFVVVARADSKGAVDPAFGVVEHKFGNGSSGLAVTLDGDGRILIAGNASLPSGQKLLLARLWP